MDYGDDYYLIPKVLFQDDFYKDLVPLDIIVYSVLRNKQEEAIEKGWVDDEGNIYLAYRIEDLAKIFLRQNDYGRCFTTLGICQLN